MNHVAANGIDVSFELHGTDHRGTLLLICGTGQPAAMWSVLGTLGGLVEAGYRVATFDNRGMVGASCPSPPWTVGEMADDATAILEAIGPAHVLGVSLGALITQTVALRRPDLVRTATLMVGGGQFGAAYGQAMVGIIELHAAGVRPPQGLENFMMLQAMLTPEQRTDPALVELALAMAAGLTDSFGPGGKYGQYSASATWIGEDHMSELAAIELPVLVIANELDPIFPPVGLRAVADAVHDGAYVEIPGASHVAMDPTSLQTTLNAVTEFLSLH